MPHLPEDPSLESLRKRAKELLRALRAGDAVALARFRAHHPRADEALAAPRLADAQLAVARAFGFASWPRLKAHLALVERLRCNPFAPAPGAEALADRLARRACLSYGNWRPEHLDEARRLLREHPELPGESLHAAAAAGDVEAARALLDAEPRLAHARGGPHGWEPLLYAAYSRLEPADGRSTLAVARLLLERGADPDAGFLWRGNVPPFTALTGAFGEGEDGNNQPPHPERDALARLLLEAGADPNDEQTLYNRHFRSDDGHLRLLFAYGLGEERGGPWHARLGERMHGPRQALVEELWAAAGKGFTARVELLLAHGVDPDAPGRRDGRTAYEAALRAGHRAIAERLARHGARRVELDPAERLACACVAGERDEARALLARDPGLLERLGAARRGELLASAVEAGRTDGVRLMAELGFDLSPRARTTPLHDAAWAGNVAMVELLVALGADPAARDREFGATPLGWARHNRQQAVVEALLPHADLFDALEAGAVERVAELLREDPSRARSRDAAGRAPVLRLHAGLQRVPELLALLQRHGAELDARDTQGRTLLDLALAGGHDELAAHLRRHGVPASGGQGS